jgi:hypothetical protein
MLESTQYPTTATQLLYTDMDIVALVCKRR